MRGMGNAAPTSKQGPGVHCVAVIGGATAGAEVASRLADRGITVNAIAPGFIETEMTAALDQKVVEGWREGIPLKRGGSPADVANACVFLGSDLSSYITGQTLSVCGGLLM